ncbi:MAG: hypothetical protein LUG99_13220 [Lachnospiraceae bacterium]|nr:hypothetical protein [Lachnospiraceae bacterium]
MFSRDTPVAGTETVTLHLADILPDIFALIVVVPAPTAEIVPSEPTVATEELELVHVTSPYEPDGDSLYLRLKVSPLFSESFDLASLILLTFFLTVTLHVALTLSEILAVMVAVPVFFATSFPFLFTDTTLELLLLHEIFSVVSDGFTVATSVLVPPTPILRLEQSSFTLFALTLTFTLHVAFRPVDEETVMVAVPALLAVMIPVEETEATLESLLLNVNAAVDPEGENEYLSCFVFPLFNVTDVLFSTIFFAFFFTVTSQEIEILLAVLAVIVVVPLFFAVTIPFESTEATETSLLNHVIDEFAPDGDCETENLFCSFNASSEQLDDQERLVAATDDAEEVPVDVPVPEEELPPAAVTVIVHPPPLLVS